MWQRVKRQLDEFINSQGIAHELVVVIALRIAGVPTRGPNPLDAEIDTLKAAGTRVELITPDEASQSAFGVNLMDARVRPAAAKAGLAQGRAMAGSLSW